MVFAGTLVDNATGSKILRSARKIAVEKFNGLSLEEVRRATMLHLEYNAYDDVRSRDATTLEE